MDASVATHDDISPEMDSFTEDRMQAEEQRLQAWCAAVKEGDEQLDQGEGIPYTASVLSEISEAALSSLHDGAPIDADVLP